MHNSAFSFDGITKRYPDGTLALDGASVAVEGGEIIGIVGRNGAGKTTAVRIAIGALVPTKGTVGILGQLLTPDATDLKRRIGYVPAEDLLFDHLTGQEQVLLTAMAYGVPQEIARARFEEAIQTLDLRLSIHRRIRGYSHGMKKKIALTCALIHDPSLLFFDEPLEGLDVLTARMLKSALRIMQERGKTLVITSHNLSLIDDICSRVVVLDSGRVLFDGAIRKLKEDTGLLPTDCLEDAFVRIVGPQDSPSPFSWISNKEGF
jgi:ABC-2 type transport system ATP-binding protein